jgi:hypothetical protein
VVRTSNSCTKQACPLWGHPAPTNVQLSDSDNNVVFSHRRMFDPKRRMANRPLVTLQGTRQATNSYFPEGSHSQRTWTTEESTMLGAVTNQWLVER